MSVKFLRDGEYYKERYDAMAIMLVTADGAAKLLFKDDKVGALSRISSTRATDASTKTSRPKRPFHDCSDSRKRDTHSIIQVSQVLNFSYTNSRGDILRGFLSLFRRDYLPNSQRRRSGV